jgi:hypothetical protein
MDAMRQNRGTNDPRRYSIAQLEETRIKSPIKPHLHETQTCGLFQAKDFLTFIYGGHERLFANTGSTRDGGLRIMTDLLTANPKIAT